MCSMSKERFKVHSQVVVSATADAGVAEKANVETVLYRDDNVHLLSVQWIDCDAALSRADLSDISGANRCELGDICDWNSWLSGQYLLYSAHKAAWKAHNSVDFDVRNVSERCAANDLFIPTFATWNDIVRQA